MLINEIGLAHLEMATLIKPSNIVIFSSYVKLADGNSETICPEKK